MALRNVEKTCGLVEKEHEEQIQRLEQQFDLQYGNNFFPLLKQLPSLLKGAVMETSLRIQNDPVISLMMALNTMAFASQKSVDVMTPAGQKLPTSLYGLCLADSAEGKTGVEDAFLAPIREYENSLQLLKSADIQILKLEYDATKKLYQKAIKQGDTEEKETLSLKLKELSQKMKDANPKVLLAHVTHVALLDALDINPSMYMSLSEGGDFFKKSENIAEVLNGAFDGHTIANNKAHTSYNILEPRLSLSILTQPHTVEAYFEKNSALIENGFLPRFLVATAMPFKGKKQYQSFSSTVCLNYFNARILELLHNAQQENKKCLYLSREAEQVYAGFWQFVEYELNYSYKEIATFATKMKVTVCRLAAVLSFFQNEQKTEIFKSDMLLAVELCHFFLAHVKSIFDNKKQKKQLADAEVLEQYLQSKADKLKVSYWNNSHNGLLFSPEYGQRSPVAEFIVTINPDVYYFQVGNLLHNLSPHYLRKREVLEPLLFMLEQQQIITILRDSSGGPIRNRQNYIEGFVINGVGQTLLQDRFFAQNHKHHAMMPNQVAYPYTPINNLGI